MMTAKKMGRPPIENPKSNRVTVRFTEQEKKILDAYCEKYKKSRAEGVRDGILLLENK